MYPRNYITFRASRRSGYCQFLTTSDPYDDECVRNEDHMLHKTLTEIFRERFSTSDQLKELLHASHQDSTIKLVLERKPKLGDIFPKDTKIPLLWIAVSRCYQKTAELLLRSGANVNVGCVKLAQNLKEIRSILHLLVDHLYPSSWNDQFVGQLLDYGADFKSRDPYGETLLHRAVCNNRIQVMKLLLEKGADANAADIDGRTPLLLATRYSEADKMLPLLIKHGADLTVRDSHGRNFLHQLAFAPEEHVELARVAIQKGVSLDDREREYQYQPIHEAACWGKDGLVKLFLDHGANVNARARDDVFPLYLAAAHHIKIKSAAVLLTLLKRGANIDLKTIQGRTALHAACIGTSNKEENIKILISAGADVFVKDADGIAALTISNFEGARRLMLRMLVLTKTCLKSSIESKDEVIIRQDPKLWTYYQDCHALISKVESTKLSENCTFFELLTKCQCQIAPLMCNPDFERKFRLYDLDVLFSEYAGEILEAFERARSHYNSILEQEAVIDEAVYNILPHLLVRKIASYITNCEACELRKIAHASRGSNSNNSNPVREP